MNNKQKLREIIAQIEKIKLKDCLSQQLQSYLYYQHIKVTQDSFFMSTCGVCSPSLRDVPEAFKRAFKALSAVEKAQIYLMNARNAQNILNQETANTQRILLKNSSLFKKQKLFSDSSLNLRLKSSRQFKNFTPVQIEILQRQKIIRIIHHRIQLDLHDYLIRKSKNLSIPSLILESTQQMNPLGNTVRITCQKEQTQYIFSAIAQVWMDAQLQVVRELVLVQGCEFRASMFSKNDKPKSSMLQIARDSFRSSSSSRDSQWLGSAFSQPEQPLQQKVAYTRVGKQSSIEIMKTFSSFDKFTEVSFGEYHETNGGSRVRKVIQFEGQERNLDFYQKLIQEEWFTKKRKSTLQLVKILQNNETIGLEKIKQVHHLGQQDIEFTFHRFCFYHHGSAYIIEKSRPQNEHTLKLQSIVRANVEYCIWRLRQRENRVELFVEAKIQYRRGKKSIPDGGKKFTSFFIGDLGTIIEEAQKCRSLDRFNSAEFIRQDLSQISIDEDTDEFYTVQGSIIDDRDLRSKNSIDAHLSFCSIEEEYPVIEEPSIREFTPSPQKKVIQAYSEAQKPAEKSSPELMSSERGHFLWEDQWIVAPNGDLVNINQEKINVQSSVLKLVLKRIGKNLLMGKSILNISLPIQIFGVDSNLQRLAKGYIYAPKFLQRACRQQDPVVRMVDVLCFGLGFSLSYIKMQKPFNPILGETYQGIIDGCPVYGEQISHHPPISSLLIVGRGYRAHGSFEAKVEMGMNSASGINEGFNNIEFEHDQSVVRLTSPPGEISGLVYGDRRLSLVKKSYCFDQKNLLICEISWGRKPSSVQPESKLNDYFQGRILKLKSVESFENYRSIKPKQIQSQCGVVSGRFTQFLKFNHQVVFCVNNEAPFLMKDLSPCLESDARFRQDIIFRKQNNFSMAQEAKQQLENLQRADRKLRARH